MCIIQRKNCITLKRKYWIDRSDGACSTSFQAEKEMDILAKAIIEGKNIHDIEEIKIHADWVDEWRDSYDITTENIESIIQKEIADCFVQVLECAGVYKRTEKGIAAFKRFLSVL